MGVMIEGRWHDRWYDTKASEGRFVRSESQFRNWVTPDGEPGPTGSGGFKAEPGRYHLYVALACPWSHRTLMFRALKGLAETITVSTTHWFMGAEGWTFEDGPGVVPDPIHGARRVHEIYKAASSSYTGRVTVPVLWDKQNSTIVSNESADIIRMMNSAFDGVGATAEDFYPEPLRPNIDAINSEIYERVNNGVYRAGFATSQAAYEEAVMPLFVTLDRLEALLGKQRYLCGDKVTEADWRLFPTLVRFDPVYVGHFKCNIRRLSDYPNLWAYTRELFQWPGIGETVNFEHIKRHYYASHESINPSRVVPIGPFLDFDMPHNRGRSCS
ncbi:glutathione S-transferase family protein [Acidisoma cellulosilytica]|uniref:Glutathione S-transferase family protein n=1 Tax=Acidisoma cellulosilyticum TaxID=2802395 RepID=A0A963Z5D0_9PROT|nr:glutathione S-transferase family protein [Acidisoma cellulosilyticum]MCB8882988.1 glutathione S-transferase family protein [Acidisoma cellulosilyticum]